MELKFVYFKSLLKLKSDDGTKTMQNIMTFIHNHTFSLFIHV